jgi:hypothetical protein
MSCEVVLHVCISVFRSINLAVFENDERPRCFDTFRRRVKAEKGCCWLDESLECKICSSI